MKNNTYQAFTAWLSRNYPLILVGLVLLSTVRHSALVYMWLSHGTDWTSLVYSLLLVLVLDASVMAFTRQGDKSSAAMFGMALFWIACIYFVKTEYEGAAWLIYVRWFGWFLFAALPAYAGYRFAHVFSAIRTQTEIDRLRVLVEGMAAAMDEMEQAAIARENALRESLCNNWATMLTEEVTRSIKREQAYIRGLDEHASRVKDLDESMHRGFHRLRAVEEWIAERQQKINAGRASANARNGEREVPV